MAQSQLPPPTRPSVPQHHPSYPHDFSASNGRPNSFSPQSPQTGMNYSSPSSQQHSSQQYSQPPAAKRPRRSPEVQSPFSPPSFSPLPGAPGGSTGGNGSINGSAPPLSRPGLMAPPQRPAEKTAEDRNYEDILSGTGINIEEEARILTRQDYYGHPTAPTAAFQARPGSFEYQINSFGRPGSSGMVYGSQQDSAHGPSQAQAYRPSAEEKAQRDEARADWEAARHTQHPLWDMFLYGGTLNDRIRKISLNEHLIDPQAGVLVNTQKHAPPPAVRVNGLEGASRVIDKGQAILDTGQKGERLSEVMKLVCLATKSRLTGLLSASARLALERQQHSKGRVPTEWETLAVVPPSAGADVPDHVSSPAGGASIKRMSSAFLHHGQAVLMEFTGTHSQANSESSHHGETVAAPHRIAAVFQKVAQAERAAEEARRAKRAKRRAAATAEGPSAAAAADATAEAALAAVLDPERKTTKKERKLAESKFSEQQQHKSANEAARMAVSGLLGGRFGSKRQKTYDWMNAGKGGGGSPGGTPGRPLASTSTSAAATPGAERPRPVPKDKQFGLWDEDRDPGIQARDVLLVLEDDGRAPRSFVRGYSLLDH